MLSSMCKLILNVITVILQSVNLGSVLRRKRLRVVVSVFALDVCQDSKVKRILPLSATIALSKSIK